MHLHHLTALHLSDRVDRLVQRRLLLRQVPNRVKDYSYLTVELFAHVPTSVAARRIG